MRAWLIRKGSDSLDGLFRADRPEPQAGPGQVVVRVKAASLNYRDQAIVKGQYFLGPVSRDLIPLSDCAGEVIAVGDGARRFKIGDRVAATFFQRPLHQPGDAPAALGSPLDGVLTEQIAAFEDGLVEIPSHLSFEEAACLPCAGVTAWHALFRAGKPLRAGETVLVLGTGGVSTFALQLAVAAGARVIATSSSDAKLARARELGASAGINYTQTPEWDQQVTSLTDARGVDCVVEVGGAGTLARSFRSLARGGKVCLIGVLTGPGGDTSPYPLMGKGGNLHGIFVGDREMFEEFNRAIEVNRIKPVIDKVFPFDDAAAAFKHQASGAFVGKIVVSL